MLDCSPHSENLCSRTRLPKVRLRPASGLPLGARHTCGTQWQPAMRGMCALGVLGKNNSASGTSGFLLSSGGEGGRNGHYSRAGRMQARPGLCLSRSECAGTPRPRACSLSSGSASGPYLGVVVDVHTVVRVDAFGTDNLTVSLQSLQLEKFSRRQKLKTIEEPVRGWEVEGEENPPAPQQCPEARGLGILWGRP